MYMDFSGFEEIIANISTSEEENVEKKNRLTDGNEIKTQDLDVENIVDVAGNNHRKDNVDNSSLIKSLQQQVFEQNNIDNKNSLKNQKYSKETMQSIHSGHRQRARDRFLANPDATSDYDLLELLLFLIVPRIDTKKVAKILIDKFKTLNNLFNADVKELNQYNINGATLKYLSILLKTVQQRILKQKMDEGNVINNSQILVEYCQNNLSMEKEEQFRVLFLTSKLKLIDDVNFGLSGISSVTLSYRDIVKKCIDLKAANVILYHNHPNQDVEPSRQDIETTEKIVDLLKSIDVNVIDHIIVSGNRWYSFKQENLL